MSDPLADGDEGLTAAAAAPPMAPLTASGSSSKGEGKLSSRRKVGIRKSMDADEFINLLHGSDPVKVELNRLENEVRGQNVVRSEFLSQNFVSILGKKSLIFEDFDFFFLR